MTRVKIYHKFGDGEDPVGMVLKETGGTGCVAGGVM